MGEVERALGALRSGGLVVLPTETVYGLAADAQNPRAVARIYAVKGRPADHPLILHLAAAEDLPGWAARVPSYARALAERFWPGPLTLVLLRSARVGDFLTGGQDTVAVRVPDHPLAGSVLRRFGSGLAAPSANLFGHVSPTAAHHAVADLGDRLDPAVDVVLDGGPCRVGVESTIVDCTGPLPRILRPGWIGADQIGATTGLVMGAPSDRHDVRVPGALASHYAPRAAVSVVSWTDLAPPAAARAVAPLRGLLALAGVATPPGVVRLAAPADSEEYARCLYQALREADALLLDEILVVPPPGGDAAAVAVRDRLERAATPAALGPHREAQR